MPSRGAAPIIFIRCGCGPPNDNYLENTFKSAQTRFYEGGLKKL